ncbi:predicted protein [Chaetoceros tenuissimus]|uniref:Uncharacterized protein n=1 Tax=Chaetoceros tenuissimus TaxID=426638 RepID=A0AAD3CUF0_9STRA|nr:predicted protein [Chaetoceros tenuissimus]
MASSSTNGRQDPSQAPPSQKNSLQSQRRQGNALNDTTNSKENDSSTGYSSISTTRNAGQFACIPPARLIPCPPVARLHTTLPLGVGLLSAPQKQQKRKRLPPHIANAVALLQKEKENGIVRPGTDLHQKRKALELEQKKHKRPKEDTSAEESFDGELPDCPEDLPPVSSESEELSKRAMKRAAEIAAELGVQPITDPSKMPSIREMNSVFAKCDDENDEKGMQKIEKEIEMYYFLRILYESHPERNCNPYDLLVFHLGILKLSQMMKWKKKEAVIPWKKMDLHTKGLWHVFHLRNIIVIMLAAFASVCYSWWLLHPIECILFGIRHAISRRYFRNGQLKGKVVYLFGKMGMEMGDNILFPPNTLPHLQRFRVCPEPVFPDFVFEITLGRTGLMDRYTQIHLVRIEGRVCNIRIL